MCPKKKILVLDDEGCIRDLIHEVLQDVGFDVIKSENPGMAAVHVYKADLIILDLSMSNKGSTEGLDVLIHLWEDKLIKTPVIIYSAYADLTEIVNEVKEIEELYGEGRKVYECIPKSDGLMRLVKLVERLLTDNSRENQ